MRRARVVWFLCALATLACGGKKEGEPSGKKDAPKDTAKVNPFADFADPGIIAKLEGVWAMKTGEMGQSQVWEIKGGKLTVFEKDGTSKPRFLAVVSPCSLEVADKEDPNALTRTTSGFNYMIDKTGTPRVSPGRGGFKKGDSMIACAWSIYVVQAGKCESWKQDMMHKEKWDHKPVECSVTKKDGKDALEVKTDRGADWPDSFLIDGDTLADEQMMGDLVKVKDLAEGKDKLGWK